MISARVSWTAGLTHSWGRLNYEDPKRLSRHEHRVFSQTAEDGILTEIFKRIGVAHDFFAECSPGDGRENNTLYLLRQCWRGYRIEGDARRAKAIRRRLAAKIASGELHLQHELITTTNIEGLLEKAGLRSWFSRKWRDAVLGKRISSAPTARGFSRHGGLFLRWGIAHKDLNLVPFDERLRSFAILS